MRYRILLGIFLAATVGFFLHVAMSSYIGPYISQEMAGKNVLHPPYPFFVNFIAYLTAILPVSGWAILFYLVYDRIPSNNFVWKGLLFSCLILFLKGDLIRQQVMSYIVGNPLHVAIIQSLDPLVRTF